MSTRVEHWKFLPHPVFRGGHLQTIVGIYLPVGRAPHEAVRHFVQADDAPREQGGDQLVLHEDRPANWRPDQPVVLLIHGLAGSHQSSYMRRMADRLTSRGYCVLRMDMRGCGAGRGFARQATHCGRSDDVGTAVRFLAELHPGAPTYIVGFSLGGSQTLNMLADAGDERIGNFAAAMAVCPPIDLFEVERRFATRLGRPYDKFFTRLLWKQVIDRWQLYPELAPATIPRRPSRLGLIDELVIAPAAGYKSAHDYYRGTQAGPRLAEIRQSATIIVAEDDPIVPTSPLRDYPHGEGVEALYVPGGGHLGFLGSRASGDPDGRWLDWRIIDWIMHHEELRGKSKSERRRSSRAVALPR